MREIKIGLPKRLAELRGNTSQAAFAKSLGVLQQTYARWELGDRQPKLQDLAALASHFGVTTDWLLGLTENKDGVGEMPSTTSRDIERLRADAAQVCVRSDSFIAAIENLRETLERFSLVREAVR